MDAKAAHMLVLLQFRNISANIFRGKSTTLGNTFQVEIFRKEMTEPG